MPRYVVRFHVEGYPEFTFVVSAEDEAVAWKFAHKELEESIFLDFEEALSLDDVEVWLEEIE